MAVRVAAVEKLGHLVVVEAPLAVEAVEAEWVAVATAVAVLAQGLHGITAGLR